LLNTVNLNETGSQGRGRSCKERGRSPLSKTSPLSLQERGRGEVGGLLKSINLDIMTDYIFLSKNTRITVGKKSGNSVRDYPERKKRTQKHHREEAKGGSHNVLASHRCFNL